jgi:hypothetical protein
MNQASRMESSSFTRSSNSTSEPRSTSSTFSTTASSTRQRVLLANRCASGALDAPFDIVPDIGSVRITGVDKRKKVDEALAPVGVAQREREAGGGGARGGCRRGAW